MSSNNLGSAILLIGIIWFGQAGWAWWHYALALFAVGTWAIATGTNEAKDLMRAKTRYYEAKALSLNRKPGAEK